MARWLLPLLLLALALGGVWLYGRAPSPAVLEDLAARFHEDRAARHAALAARLAVLPAEATGRREAETRLAALLRNPKRTEVRGWEVVLLPPGAPRPAPADYLRGATWASVRAEDPPPLRGTYEVWVAPRGAVARLVRALSGR